MYIIIVGAGKIGSNLIRRAVNDGNDVVVIEQKRDVAEDISAEHDCMVLNADATQTDVLHEARIDHADAIISTTNLDAVNIMVMLLAREHEVSSLVSVVHDASHIPIFEKIGVHIMGNPQQLIADHLYHSVRYPGVLNFMRLDDESEFIEVISESDAPIIGRSLESAKSSGVLPETAIVAAIKRDDRVVAPAGTTAIQEGDLVTVLVTKTSADAVLRAFGHTGENGG